MESAFVKSLRAAAQKRRARVVLADSVHPGALEAAARAQRDGVADCVVLGDPDEIRAAAGAAGARLDGVTVMAPPAEEMADSLADLRAGKGMSREAARDLLLRDMCAAAAMMVRVQRADGMVAGASTPSAAVLRPILQLIGKAPGEPLASSFFAMDLPEGPKLFADCALNIAPDAAQLAAIGAQTARSARRLGIEPSAAFLSYATGDSAGGAGAEKMKEAARLARELDPACPAFGPVQYDAAVSPSIGAAKAPAWEDAGRANVLVFPDLAAGNIAYKAVQQASGVAAIGPLLQGTAAPANDLSRGAAPADIYWTIAATSALAP